MGSQTPAEMGVERMIASSQHFGCISSIWSMHRYERSEGGVRTGRALVQRHVALSSDVANKEGQGLLVSS